MRSSKEGGNSGNRSSSNKNALARLIRTKQTAAGLGQALVILVMILPQMATDGKTSRKGSEILQSI